jgi:hypothetical protein
MQIPGITRNNKSVAKRVADECAAFLLAFTISTYALLGPVGCAMWMKEAMWDFCGFLLERGALELLSFPVVDEGRTKYTWCDFFVAVIAV